MRSTIIAAAALAAGAFAVPYEKRDVVTNTNVEMVYVTDVVTVTAGSAPTEEAQAQAKHYGHKKPGWWGQPHKQPSKHTTTVEAPAPEPTTSDSWSPPATQSEPAPTSQRSAPASAPTDYASKAILHHNIHRQNHSAPDIEWSSDLEASAKAVAQSCVYAHNVDEMGGGYGQNIA